MADFAPTAANVVPSSSAQTAQGTAGETITAGMTLYINTSDSNKLYKAQNDGTSLQATVCGIAINGASAGQPVKYVTSGSLTLGSITSGAAGLIAVLSTTFGGMAPSTDLASTRYVTVLGVLTSATVLQVSIINSGTQYA